MIRNSISIKCVNTDATHAIEPGLALAEIAKKLNIKLKTDILGAQVNNKTLGVSSTDLINILGSELFFQLRGKGLCKILSK